MPSNARIRLFVSSRVSGLGAFAMSDDPREKAAVDLKIARADAIHSYAGVEQSLCTLFAHLLKTGQDLAAVVFFQIIATRSRSSILETLMEKRFKGEYSKYWFGVPGVAGVKKQSGLFALIQQLDTTRNFVVHWNVAVNVGDGPITESLIPPNFWDFVNDQRSLTVAEIKAFSVKADFVSASINMFNLFVLHEPKILETPDTWKEIFQQPCVYPPANTHPLFPKT